MSDDLRFPVGRPDPRSPLTPEERAERIERIATFPDRLREGVAGLSDEQLDTPYREGGWTLRQVVHHIPDSHLNGYLRFKLAVTEDEPEVRGYREELWAELSEARTGPLELSLPLIEALHRRWSTFLSGLEAGAWARPLHYSDGRRMDLDRLLCIYSWHGDHHLAHIRGLREREGW